MQCYTQKDYEQDHDSAKVEITRGVHRFCDISWKIEPSQVKSSADQFEKEALHKTRAHSGNVRLQRDVDIGNTSLSP